eukprot:TRINITY_DN2042_c0_g1_i3.p1 TRINITY_DN2042_c0_g1~~TRINITY_DN2042_c0_g1_i3.p1  ORF type:complete len:657 (-),score=91.08 TRINITY_DN2042_c0_g1_i3:83-2053(-)
MKASILLVLLTLLGLAWGDMYLHNPRGSNNRVNEANTNRNNANRLMDTQNNGKGGYCLGPRMQFYAGSQLTIEWTNQHGCGNPKLYCNIVIQYMCGRDSDSPLARIRDGADTDRIPNDVAGAMQTNANGDLQFGMHESLQYYQNCATRSRNFGLWISDRENEGGLGPGRRAARFTRQNNNGNRNGLECAEERDYYPYWHPTPWRDIAVLAQSNGDCGTYTSESQNNNDKCHCVDSTNPQQEFDANNQLECETSVADGTEPNAVWRCEGSFGIGAPFCDKAAWSRDNHLGNGMTGFTNNYNWTLPMSVNVASDPVADPWNFDTNCVADGNNDPCVCVLRIRYNISTTDLNVRGDQFENLPSIGNGNDPDVTLDSRFNAPFLIFEDDQITEQDGLPHELALDTSQFGRTFQDRSHTFNIISRSSANVANDQSLIYNLNVRGKRGNIVQTYPATEYDFVPQQLNVRVGDYIHFQWTGCDTNPAGNAGEGTAQTDRSNIVQLENFGANIPARDSWLSGDRPLFRDRETRMRAAYLDQDLSTCLNREELLQQNNGNNNEVEQDVQNCMKLNAAPTPYFNVGVVQMNTVNDFHFMSSRNNNFSNRGQKGTISVSPLIPVALIVLIVLGGVACLASAGIAGLLVVHKVWNPSALAWLSYLNKV